ncbi:uncharacterized protein LOC114264419 isoform X9 [Camellia sinensis]|nr:uncharacterized protein LOC114264419 isoform X9 [Camellia sinensis]
MWFSKIKNQNHQQGPSKSKARLARSFFPFAMRSSVAPPLLIFSFSVLLSIFSCSSDDTTFNGAALGYWMVRKFVIAEDGSVDVGVAQFVKWAMRVIAATFIFLSTLDTPLAMGALASCLSICFLITSFKWNGPDRSGMVASRGTLWNSPRRPSGWSDSPVKV